jgi:hypothetical protein
MFRDKKTLDTPFSKGEKVLATEDLRRVPEGTHGKVKLIDGFEWIRYWVFFDNGEQLGSIDGSKLVRPRHYDAFKARQAEQAAAAEKADQETVAADAGDGASGADGDAPSAAASLVPAHLLERSKAARTRLSALPIPTVPGNRI